MFKNLKRNVAKQSISNSVGGPSKFCLIDLDLRHGIILQEILKAKNLELYK